VALTTTTIHRTIEAICRIESARITAGLTRIVRDIDLAEDLAQDALVAAFEQWPESGIPENPGAWLMATAKHRAIDHFRRSQLLDRKQEELGREFASRETAVPDFDAAIDDSVGDDLLRLVFIACHPVLSSEARVALTLRLLGGLTTKEIAREFLAPETTIGQRIVRAKPTLAEAHIPFEVPRQAEFAARLSSVLQVIYLIFNEGYLATAGDDWMRPALCEDALRLGRILAGLVPREPEVHGLGLTHGNPGIAIQSAGGRDGNAHLASRSRARPVGSAPNSSRSRRTRGRQGTRRCPGPLCTAGGNCRLPRSRPYPGRDRLEEDRVALR